ncbi:esterase OVCA2 isoform X4 [Lampetra planeri]
MCVYCVYCVCTVCVQCGCTVCTVCTVRVHCVQCVCAVCVQCGAVCALPARCRPPRHGRRARRVSSSAAVYISAPNVIPAQREEEEAAGGDGDTHTDDQRAWWFTVDPARAAPGERLFDSTAASALSVGFDDSVLAIARTLTELGPFHGILGFSQGASMASLILAMQRDNAPRSTGARTLAALSPRPACTCAASRTASSPTSAAPSCSRDTRTPASSSIQGATSSPRPRPRRPSTSSFWSGFKETRMGSSDRGRGRGYGGHGGGEGPWGGPWVGHLLRATASNSLPVSTSTALINVRDLFPSQWRPAYLSVWSDARRVLGDRRGERRRSS